MPRGDLREGVSPVNHYDRLQISRHAQPVVIRAAYRALCQQHHPDKNPGDPSAHDLLLAINEAYAVLSDPARRAEYDRTLSEASRPGAAAPARGSGSAAGAPMPRRNAQPPLHRQTRTGHRRALLTRRIWIALAVCVAAYFGTQISKMLNPPPSQPYRLVIPAGR